MQETIKKLEALDKEKNKVLETQNALKMKLEGYEDKITEIKRDYEAKLKEVFNESNHEKEDMAIEIRDLKEELVFFL